MKKNGLFNFVTELIRVKYDAIRLRYAIYLADSKQRAYNKQYFVLPDGDGKLRVLCKADIKALKRGVVVKAKGSDKGVRVRLMSKRVTHMDVMRECFYYTPYNLNSAQEDEWRRESASKSRAWLEWIKQYRIRKAMRQIKK